MHHHTPVRPFRPRLRRPLLPVLALILSAALLSIPLGARATPTVWTRFFGTPELETSRALFVDSAGNLYMTGNTVGDLVGPNGGVSYYGVSFVNKYDPAGVLQWTRELGRKASFESVISSDVAVDAAGRVYVVGSTNVDLQGQFSFEKRYATIHAYDSAGTLQWTRQFGSSGRSTVATAIALDAQGHLYVTGSADDSLDGQPSAGTSDVFLTKYSPAGTREWTRQYGQPGSDGAVDLTLDAAGAVYLVGYTTGELEGQPLGGFDAFITRFSADGTREWTRLLGKDTVDGIARITASPAGVADGGLYIVGVVLVRPDDQRTARHTDLFISRLDADGTLQWMRQLSSPANDEASGVAVDLDGNIYLSGNTFGNLAGQRNAGEEDMLVSKYDPSGRALWTFLYGSAQDDRAFDVAVGGQGQLYLMGQTEADLDGQRNAGQIDAFISQLINPTLTPRTFLPLLPR